VQSSVKRNIWYYILCGCFHNFDPLKTMELVAPCHLSMDASRYRKVGVG
jgi:hypothetical protein